MSQCTEILFVPSGRCVDLPEDCVHFLAEDTSIAHATPLPIFGKRYLTNHRLLAKLEAEGWTLELRELESGVHAYVLL